MAAETPVFFGPSSTTPAPFGSRLWLHGMTRADRKLYRGIEKVGAAMFERRLLCIQCYAQLDGSEPFVEVMETGLDGRKRKLTAVKCKTCGSLNYHTPGYIKYLRFKGEGEDALENG